MSNNSIKSLINDITEINKIIKNNKIETEINIESILEKILTKEKEYSIIKYNLNNCKNNLENNLKLIKQKCEIEYKIYEILMDHKQKLDTLQQKHKMDIPNLDSFVQNLFNLSVENKSKMDTSKKLSSKVDSSKSVSAPKETKKINADILQEQLNAAIMSRRSAINPD